MQGFYFLVKFGFALNYILKVYCKKILFDFIEEKHVQFITYIFFFLFVENHVPSQVLKDFSVENVETTLHFFPKILF